MSIMQEKIADQSKSAPERPISKAVAQKTLKIGVIGYGYWGPKLVRNFQESSATRVTVVADRDIGRLIAAQQAHTDVIVTDNYRELLESDVDAVALATPVSTHFTLGRECLLHGKHLLVEKPLVRHRDEGRALISLASERGLVLMVGHTFEYNPAVETLREIVSSGEIGRVFYVYSTRTNLGIFQRDVNVLWDLAPHDISILMYVLQMDPIDVCASGQAYVQPPIHDVARLTVNFPNQVQAHIHVSWLDPRKERRITIVGDKKMVIYDDVETLEKIKIYDKGVEAPAHTDNYGEFQLSYRYGDIVIPRIPLHEPLKVECTHFADAILNGRRPRSDGEVGLKVVKVLESAEKSLLNGGNRQRILW